MIQDNLENEIYSHISQNVKYPTLIIMHPQTWINLTKEVFDSGDTSINMHDLLLKYKGVRVLRSFDMIDGVFIVN